MKRVVMLVCVLLLLVAVIAGCSENPTEDSSQNSESNSTQEKQENQENQEKIEPEEVVTIEVASEKPMLESYFSEIIRRFEAENPNIKVNITYKANSAELSTYLSTIFQSGKGGVDLFSSNGLKTGIFRGYIEEGLLEPLDDYLDVPEEFGDGPVFFVTYDDQLYQIPTPVVDTFPVFYNVEIFEENGLKEPETYDEWVALCDTLMEKGIQPMTLDGKHAVGVGWNFWNYVQLVSPEWCVDFMEGNAKFDDPRFREGLARFKYFIDQGYFGENWQGLDENGAILELTSGKAAMFCSVSVTAHTIMEGVPDFKFDAFYPPTDDGQSSMMISPNCNAGFGMYSKSEHKEEAAKFLQYLISFESVAYFAELGSYVVSYDGLEDYYPNETFKKLSSADIELPLWVTSATDFEREGISGLDVLFTTVQSFAFGTMTADEVVKECDDAMDYSQTPILPSQW